MGARLGFAIRARVGLDIDTGTGATRTGFATGPRVGISGRLVGVVYTGVVVFPLGFEGFTSSLLLVGPQLVSHGGVSGCVPTGIVAVEAGRMLVVSGALLPCCRIPDGAAVGGEGIKIVNVSWEDGTDCGSIIIVGAVDGCSVRSEAVVGDTRDDEAVSLACPSEKEFKS